MSDIFAYIEERYMPKGTQNKGSISRFELLRFFTDLGIAVKGKETSIDLLVTRFCKDRKVGRISMPEWVSELQMKSVSY